MQNLDSTVKIIGCYRNFATVQLFLNTHPSPSLSRTTLNSTADPSTIVSYDVNTVWKAIVSELDNAQYQILTAIDDQNVLVF